MLQRYNGIIDIDGKTVVARLIELFTRCITQTHFKTGRVIVTEIMTVSINERQEARGLMALMCHTCRNRKAVEQFQLIVKGCRTQVGHLVIGLATNGKKSVVLTGELVVLPYLVHIIFMPQLERVDGKLVAVVFLFIERVLQFTSIFQFLVLESVGNIALSEQMLVEVGRCHTAHFESETLKFVPVHECVEWPKIKLARRSGCHIAVDQHERHLLSPVEKLGPSQLGQHATHIIFLSLSDSGP